MHGKLSRLCEEPLKENMLPVWTPPRVNLEFACKEPRQEEENELPLVRCPVSCIITSPAARSGVWCEDPDQSSGVGGGE